VTTSGSGDGVFPPADQFRDIAGIDSSAHVIQFAQGLRALATTPFRALEESLTQAQLALVDTYSLLYCSTRRYTSVADGSCGTEETWQ
jgi:hypothetical protein